MKRPVTNVVKVSTEAMKELHEMNVECVMEGIEKRYEDCFPAYFSRAVMINGKEYYLTGEIKLMEKK